MDRHTVGIVGFGRFGQFWAQLLTTGNDVLVTDRNEDLAPKATERGVTFEDLATVCDQSDSIFLCVPINQFESVVSEIKSRLRPGMTVIDTCSVKAVPAKIMERELSPVLDLELISMHPMFGPDSAAQGLSDLPIVMWPISGTRQRYNDWQHCFQSMGLRVIEVSPDQHDRLAAYSQGVTHYIGRVLGELGLQQTPIDTRGFSNLLAVVEQTCNDSWELFFDLQNYNPYTQQMRLSLEGALHRVYEKLLPSRASPDHTIIGIQGGQGSFNEEACRHFCAAHPTKVGNFQIEYLFTASGVLTALHEGRVDYGMFALQNAKGGAVMETITALSERGCRILETFSIVVNHCILRHRLSKFEEIDTLVSHPQALAQCADNLSMRYPHLRLVSGEGDLIDQAHCAKYIADGRLPRTTAVLASKVCADVYGLTIHDTDLQDLGADNRTTFAWVKRR